MFDYSRSNMIYDVDPLERNTSYAVNYNVEDKSVNIEYSVEEVLVQRICFRNTEIAKKVHRALGTLLEG
jgi:hypothetical protein